MPLAFLTRGCLAKEQSVCWDHPTDFVLCSVLGCVLTTRNTPYWWLRHLSRRPAIHWSLNSSWRVVCADGFYCYLRVSASQRCGPVCVFCSEPLQTEVVCIQQETARQCGLRLSALLSPIPSGCENYRASWRPFLSAWLTHGAEFGRAIRAVISAGGDVDTTAAITGGIVGATLGPPNEMFTNPIAEWPASIAWQRNLGEQLAEVMESGIPDRPISVPWTGLLLRNCVFLVIVLSHGLRRLLPPW